MDNKFLRILAIKKIGSLIRFDDFDTETETCFPISVIVWVAFSSSVGTHINSKLKMAMLLNSGLSFKLGY